MDVWILVDKTGNMFPITGQQNSDRFRSMYIDGEYAMRDAQFLSRLWNKEIRIQKKRLTDSDS